MKAREALSFVYTNKCIYTAKCKRDKSSNKIIYGFGAFDVHFPEFHGTYVGFIEQEVSNGSGMLRMMNNTNTKQITLYTGMFQHGERHGWGQQEMDDQVYVGQFCHNYRHGVGSCHFKDSFNTVYEGEWKDGVMWGAGELSSLFTVNLTQNGYVQTGDHKHTFKYVFQGQWEEGKRHGVGLVTITETDNTCTIYVEGEWDKNQLNNIVTYSHLSARKQPISRWQQEINHEVFTQLEAEVYRSLQ